MSAHYTNADQHAGYEAILALPVEHHPAEAVMAILDAVASAIAARAKAAGLREYADALADNEALAHLDGRDKILADVRDYADHLAAVYAERPDYDEDWQP